MDVSIENNSETLSLKESTTPNKTESLINIIVQQFSQNDLEVLEKRFKDKQNAEEQGLTKSEFVDIVCSLYNDCDYSSKSLLLFDKISNNVKAKIQWMDFLDFLIENSYPQVENNLVLTLSSIESVSHAKSESVAKIVLIETEKYFCYAIILKHGRIGLYDGNLNFLTSYHVIMTREDITRSEKERRRRNRWVTDAMFCADYLMLIVTNTARSIIIYDASGLQHIPIWLILSTPNVIECLCYKSCDTNEIFLFGGDSNGEVICFKFLQPKFGFLRRKYNDKISIFYWMELPNEKQFVRVKQYGKVHHYSIKRISYYKENDILVTCSRDPEASVIIKHVGNKRKSLVFKMLSGTSCFALSSFHKILLTGSQNGIVRLWNTAMTTNPVAIISAHVNDIVDIKILENQELFLSCGSDGILKLWDLKENNTCLQTTKIEFPCFKIQGKCIEWGIECIYPGPKRKFVSEDIFYENWKNCFKIDNISEQKEEADYDSNSSKDTSDLWERSHILVTCCNFMAKLSMCFKDVEIESTFMMPVAQPPPLQNSVLIPKSWKAQEKSYSKQNIESDINMYKHFEDLSFILDKDLLEAESLKSDINYKIAILETKKRQMQQYVGQGAPYLAMDLYDIEELTLSKDLPTPSKSSTNLAQKLEKVLSFSNWKDQAFSDSSSSSKSRRSSLRSSIVELPD